ncbi:hypothetical protein [Campylobacter insulaenigrae]|uniref:hypothetical protein n=1 Tax=Campylobacter insulaenigrae TaxID=260714 RepID=UPI002153A52D|nr:hypothetical protein [Campylobacter insulaenigrae]MCR6594569.1 hypothetical protein [Campylobacter insulaenigrae]
MFRLDKFVDNKITRFNFSSHFIMLSFFILMFLSACGYKDVPFYEKKDDNQSEIKIKKFQAMENEI